MGKSTPCTQRLSILCATKARLHRQPKLSYCNWQGVAGPMSTAGGRKAAVPVWASAINDALRGGAPFLPTALLPVLGFRFQPRQGESPQSSSITAEPQGLNAHSLESTALAKGSGNRPVLHLELNIAARSPGPSRGSGNTPPRTF